MKYKCRQCVTYGLRQMQAEKKMEKKKVFYLMDFCEHYIKNKQTKKPHQYLGTTVCTCDNITLLLHKYRSFTINHPLELNHNQMMLHASKL